MPSANNRFLKPCVKLYGEFFYYYLLQCGLTAKAPVAQPGVPARPGEVARVQRQQFDTDVHRFAVAACGHQHNAARHLPDGQTPGHRLPKLVIGTEAFTHGSRGKG